MSDDEIEAVNGARKRCAAPGKVLKKKDISAGAGLDFNATQIYCQSLFHKR